MKYVIYTITIIFLAGLQMGLFGYLRFFGAAPNLLLLFVIGCCLQRDTENSFFSALMAGLFLDFLNSLFIGSFALGFLLLALLLYFIIYRLVVFELSWKYLLTVVVVSTVFMYALVYYVGRIAFHFHWWPIMLSFGRIKYLLIPEIIYNIILAYPMYMLATWIHNSILKMQGKKYRII